MGGLIEAVGNIVQQELDRIAKEIESQMIAEAYKWKATYRTPTGRAAASIHIEDIGTGSVFGAGRFIGADTTWSSEDGGTHLYYMDQGNKPNAPDGRIHPTKKKALKLKDGSVRRSVSTYRGRGFIKEIADRYR